jgi:hypothetical protein
MSAPQKYFKAKQKKDGSDCIHCDTHKDVAILQYDIAQPLTKDSEISWKWCLEELPSLLREDTLPTHDYLSLAVEFDDGRDISYYWSRDLPFEQGFDCPLPNWKGKEYHVVVRSGTDDLGKWLNERRNLYQDYQRYMGTPPANIVRVWLIANSVFQRQKGICTYSNIELYADDKSSKIL